MQSNSVDFADLRTLFSKQKELFCAYATEPSAVTEFLNVADTIYGQIIAIMQESRELYERIAGLEREKSDVEKRLLLAEMEALDRNHSREVGPLALTDRSDGRDENLSGSGDADGPSEVDETPPFFGNGASVAADGQSSLPLDGLVETKFSEFQLQQLLELGNSLMPGALASLAEGSPASIAESGSTDMNAGSPAVSSMSAAGCAKSRKRKEPKLKRAQLLDGSEPVVNKRKSLCQYCGKEFAAKHVMMFHVRAVHELRKDFNCFFCDYASGYSANLSSHVRRKHADRWSEFTELRRQYNLSRMENASSVDYTSEPNTSAMDLSLSQSQLSDAASAKVMATTAATSNGVADDDDEHVANGQGFDTAIASTGEKDLLV